MHSDTDGTLNNTCTELVNNEVYKYWRLESIKLRKEKEKRDNAFHNYKSSYIKRKDRYANTTLSKK